MVDVDREEWWWVRPLGMDDLYEGPTNCPSCGAPVCTMPPYYWRCVFCNETSAGHLPSNFQILADGDMQSVSHETGE